MIKRIIHCGDIHIPAGNRRHVEYKEVLDNFIAEVKNISLDYEFGELVVAIVGDLLHNKLDKSNEMDMIVSEFLRGLDEICPIYIIAGNHDFGEHTGKIDTITPIIKMLNLKNVRYFDMELNYKSGLIEIDNIVFCVYSIFDGYNLSDVKISRVNKPDKLHIGLFHGCLDGSALDSTHVLGGLNKELFDGCQLVLMADIHKRQFFDYNGVTLAYCGSLHQHSMGETVSSKGFLSWFVEDSDDISYEEHNIDDNNDYGFYKFKISSFSDVENGVEDFVNF